MIRHISTLLSGTALLATLLLAGCGAGGTETTTQTDKKPFLKSNRAVKDWTWEVDASITKDNNGADINTYYYENIPSEIKHFQVFIDCIPNKGFNGSDGWEVYGADYLIEDTSLFISQSDSEWKWKYLGEVSREDNQETGEEREIFIQNSTILANAIKGNSVNMYIEPYDANWVGEYYTIPLPDVTVSNNASNIDEAYMKAYVKEKYAHAGVVGVSKYSTYYKIAAVSVSYHSPSYIDVYNFQDSDTPSAVRINMNQNGLVDYSSIDVIGDIGSESIVFRMSTRGDNPTVSIVHYNLKEEKVESITVLGGGAKEILQAQLGESFVSFNPTPNAQNAIVTTRNVAGVRTYSLYDIRDEKNPTLTHHMITEESANSTRWLRIIDDSILEYTLSLGDNRSRKVRYDFIQNKEVVQ